MSLLLLFNSSDVNTGGALGATVAVTPMGAAASGEGAAGGALSTVTVSAMGGTVGVTGNATGAFGGTITVSALGGAAGVSGNATGALGGTVTVSSMGATTSNRWTPLHLATIPTHYFDPYDHGTVFNDIPGTTPLTATGTIRRLLDKGSAAAHATTSSSMHYNTAGVNGHPSLRNNNETIGISFTPSFGAITNVQFGGNTTSIIAVVDTVDRNSGNVFGTALLSPHVLEIRTTAGTGTGKIGYYLNGSNTPLAELTGLTISESDHCFLVADGVTGGSQLNFPNNGRYFRAQSTTATLANQNDLARPFDGDIGQMLYFRYALSTSELEHVQGYLGHKWGVALPSGHAFETSAPTVGIGNAAGAIGATVTVTALTGAATGQAAAAGALQTVTVSALTGTATGAAAATGTLQTVTLSAMGGGVGSPGAASGALSTVVITSLGGAASGAAAATGSLTGVTVSALTGAAVGVANATGALSGVVVSAMGAVATGAASITGALSTIVISSLVGSAAGAAQATGALQSVTITPMTGSANTSGTPGNATGAFGATVTCAYLEADVTGEAQISGSLSTVTLSAMSGAAVGQAQAVGSLVAILISALQGTATGAALASGQLQSVTITPMGGAAVAGGESFGPFTITVRDKRGVERVIGPFTVTG